MEVGGLVVTLCWIRAPRRTSERETFIDMNKKEQELYKIVDIVIGCCSMGGNEEELREKVLGGSRDDNTVLTRCMLARLLAFAGYSNATIAMLLHRDQKSVRNMLDAARDCRKSRRSYRVAEDEAMRMYREMCEEEDL